MDNKKLVYLCIIIILIATLICCTIILFNLQKETVLIGNEDSSFYTGDIFSITLSDTNGKKLFNKTVQLEFINSNNQKESYSVSTDGEGLAKFKINLNEGSYTVNCFFYGDHNYKSSSYSTHLTVLKKETVQTSDTPTVSPSSEYLVYEGPYKKFTDKIDGVYVTEYLPWDSKAHCYHW